MNHPKIVIAGVIYANAIILSCLFCFIYLFLAAYFHGNQITMFINLLGEAHFEMIAILVFFVDLLCINIYFTRWKKKHGTL